MKIHRLRTEQWLPYPRENIFPFFADVRNLQRITPPWLNFQVLTENVDVGVGSLIDYKLRVHGLPLRWQSEITLWEPPCRFVDEQRRGPYRQWIHEHRFEERDGGTCAIDTIDYAVPGGDIIHRLLVKRDVEKIFAYRQKMLAQLFPANPEGVVR